MKLWVRVFLGYFLIVGLAAVFVQRAFVQEVKPSVRLAVEEVMVDAVNLMAELLSQDFAATQFDARRIADSVQRYQNRQLRANIWGIEKVKLDFRVYVVDQQGVVRYDSEGQAQGADYSQWRDVARSLRGEYGARTTHAMSEHPSSAVMHVAAPIYRDGQIIGAVTLAKPVKSLAPLIERAEKQILRQGLWLLLGSALIGLIFTAWLSHSFRHLLHYARSLAQGERATPPSPARHEIGQLSRALYELRQALDGRAYVEHYLQHLTHELKSPLTAIQASAELLEQPLPATTQRHFSQQIQQQVQRLTAMSEHLLTLARLERQHTPQHTAVDLKALFAEVVEQEQTICAQQGLVLQSFEPPPDLPTVLGDRILLQQAWHNLIANARSFARPAPTSGADQNLNDPPKPVVSIELRRHDGWLVFAVYDAGPGLEPDADARIFERFYSRPRPDTQARSSGLGLCLVQAVAQEHGGSVVIGRPGHWVWSAGVRPAMAWEHVLRTDDWACVAALMMPMLRTETRQETNPKT